ncbi:hypothetical protein GE09DRAFT_1227759 [Coniochaeta sp. 2T2.1]|nr:hypothetical protein GE09DRAFT_1227759 [Coniochaeta sp. 2T2.1]
MAEQTAAESHPFSSADLTSDYTLPGNKKRKRTATPDQDMHIPKFTDRSRLATPNPRTPGIPSSVLTAGLTTDGSSIASAQTVISVLTIPDEKDEEDGIVRGVAIMNPFATSSPEAPRETDNRNFFLPPKLDLERKEACALVESVEVTYSKRVISEVTEEHCPEPAAKRRRIVEDESRAVFIREEDTAEAIEEDARDSVEEDDPDTVIHGIFEGVVEEAHGQEIEDDAHQEIVDDAESSDLTDYSTEEEEDTSSDEEELPEDPDYDTNSNWDQLEDVRPRLREYLKFRRTIKGHERWTPTQTKLHKLLALRGVWPMFKHSWTLTFSIRNIYPQVFAPAHTTKRVAITSRRNEFRTTRALEAIFDLSPLVHGYRQSGTDEKIGSVLKKALKRYVSWAIYDAGVEDRVFIPTVEVYEFNPRKWAGRVRRRSKAGSKGPAIKAEPASLADWPSDDDDEALSSDPISDEVEARLRRMAARHRKDLVAPETAHLPEYMWQFREPPPLLFAFVILQHMVMVVSLDAGRADNEVVVFSELDMGRADQWLWNALAIALPVHMARDALWERRERLPVVERMEVDDPDA